MKRILVTGAAGFVGRHTLPLLVAAGFDVHAMALHPSPFEPASPVAAHWHSVDLLDAAAVDALIQKVRPTHLLHFAWITLPGAYQHSPENHRWLEASLHLFRCAIAHGALRIVGAGSCFEYDWKDGLCIEGQTPLHPSTLYGICKRDCGIALLDLAQQGGVSAAWGRIFFLYGPGEPRQKFVASIVHSLLRGEDALCTHGRQIRDFLAVQDVASAFVALLQSDVTGPVNIASGVPVTLGEIAAMIGGIMDGKDRIKLGAREALAGEPPMIVADVARLRDEVGWRPGRTLREGLEETIEERRTKSTEQRAQSKGRRREELGIRN